MVCRQASLYLWLTDEYRAIVLTTKKCDLIAVTIQDQCKNL